VKLNFFSQKTNCAEGRKNKERNEVLIGECFVSFFDWRVVRIFELEKATDLRNKSSGNRKNFLRGKDRESRWDFKS
jgi:hypothetical protein